MNNVTYRDRFLHILCAVAPDQSEVFEKSLPTGEKHEKEYENLCLKIAQYPPDYVLTHMLRTVAIIKLNKEKTAENLQNYFETNEEVKKARLVYKSVLIEKQRPKLDATLTPTQARLRKKRFERMKEAELAKVEKQNLDSDEAITSLLNIGVKKIMEHSRYGKMIYLENIAKNESLPNAAIKPKRKRRNRSKKSKSTFVEKTLQQDCDKENKIISVSAKPVECSPAKKRKLFYANLFHPKSEWRYHERVSRWLKTDIEQIPKFEDFSRGEKVERYSNKSLAELQDMLAKHRLPGVERLMSEPYVKYYACETERGYAMVAQLNSNGSTVDGILFIGCHNHCVFHCFFEEKDFNQNVEDFLSENDTEFRKEAIKDEPITIRNCKVAISEDNGVITFSYPEEYSISILPLRKDLLDQELGLK